MCSFKDQLAEIEQEQDLHHRYLRFRQMALPGLDFNQCRSLGKKMKACDPELPEVRVAVLFGHTTDTMCTALATCLLATGVCPQVYAPPYGTSMQAILEPISELHAFKPHIVLLAHTYREFPLPEHPLSAELLGETINEYMLSLGRVWEVLHSSIGATIITNDMDIPPYLPLGHLETHTGETSFSFYRELNRRIYAEAPLYGPVHSIDQLSSLVGKRWWHDPRYYHHAKMHPPPDLVVQYAHSVAQLVGASRGLSAKCLVLDLDNTLWGGVIGDEGLQGIRLGVGDPDGEAFQEFQRTILSLHERGALLAVCSKNDERNALQPFEEHSGMILKREHISCFMANWNPKPQNISHIAKELNIGVDSLVFVDDNPVECEQVRQQLPQVRVIELGEDSSSYSRQLMERGYFETVHVAEEDSQRAAYYQHDLQRKSAHKTMSNEDFLSSLQMHLSIAPVTNATLPRVVQLINKTNQFNLRTQRTDMVSVEQDMGNSQWICVTGTLKDKYGDSGLIAVLTGKKEGSQVVVEHFLMSCRVLQRGVENALFTSFVQECERKGSDVIGAQYLPSAKNGLISGLLDELGFEGENGAGQRILKVGEYVPKNYSITVSVEQSS